MKVDIKSLAEQGKKYLDSFKIDYGDIRIGEGSNFGINREHGKFEEVEAGSSFGVGVRIIHNGKLGFYSSNSDDIKHSIDRAVKLAKVNPAKEKIVLKEVKPVKDEVLDIDKVLFNYDEDEIASYVKDVEKKGKIKGIHSVQVSRRIAKGNSIFVSTEGSNIYRKGAKSVCYAQITAKKGNALQRELFRRYSKFSRDFENYEEELIEVAERAIKLLDAKLPPSGKFRVLLDPENTGLFAHEAVGHASEADLVLRGDSIFEGKIGQKLGSEEVTVVDSPTAWQWGSYKYDDEGVKVGPTNVIENGVLKNYLQTRETAAKLNMDVTGNARAQSYNFLPQVRMSNTYFKPGSYSFDELLKELKNGFYLVGGGRGGMVATLEGDYTFACSRVIGVKNGELGEMYKGITFSGKIIDTLKNIIGIEKKQVLFKGGFCGKGGQYVPVGDGVSHSLVSEMYLGGES